MNARRFLLWTCLSLTVSACGVNQPGSVPLGSPCVRNSDCLAGICSDGLCVLGSDRACAPGQRRCNGSLVEECRDSGDGWARVSDCETGCAGGACVEKVCEPHSRKCEGDLVMECLPNGSGWTFFQACSTSCDTALAACTLPVCNPFETRCHPTSPGTLQTCNERGTAWANAPCGTATDDAVCSLGRCLPRACATIAEGGTIVSREKRCRGDVVEQCNDDGSGFEAVELCEYGCSQSGSSAVCQDSTCTAGETRCEGTALLRCAPHERGFEFERFCPSGCDGSDGSADCIPPTCAAYTRRCGGTTSAPVVEQCRADGTGYEAIESCTVMCDGGACVVTHAGCTPGTWRCNGREVEQCIRTEGDGTAWAFVESCFGTCSGGSCDEAGACGCDGGASAGNLCGTSARSPLTLKPLMESGTEVPADGVSTVLVYSDPIVSAEGAIVPDGTLVTFTHTGTTDLFASDDADPHQPGLQRPTLGGRARIVLRAPEDPGTITITARNSQRCAGETTLTFKQAVQTGVRHVFLAEDFSTRRNLDRGGSTAQWDTTLGRLRATPIYSFGTGVDGDLIVPDGQTVDLWSDSSRYGSGRDVLSLGHSDARVEGSFPGLAPGDEVLLVAVGGSSASSVGVYEFKHVADMAGSRITFTEPVQGVYGPVSNGNLGDQRVVLQRVPQFNEVRVGVGAQLTTTPLADGGSGIVAFRARGLVRVLGRIHADLRGLPQNTPQLATTTPALNRLLHGGGGPTMAGGGIVFIAARELTVREGGNDSTVLGEISASSRVGLTPTSNSGVGGTLWLQAGELNLGARRAIAVGAQDGSVRIDHGGSWTQNPSTPEPFYGQTGDFLITSNAAYTVPHEAGVPVAVVQRGRALGAIGGAGVFTVGQPADLPGILFQASVDGNRWHTLQNAEMELPPQTGGQPSSFRFRFRLQAIEDDPVEVHGAAWRVEIRDP